jgi:protein translocase SecG subunit
MSLSEILLVAQTVCLTAAMILILIQNRGSGLSSAFGGSDQVYLTRRGIEKSVVFLTVVSIVLFVVLRIITLYV